MRIGLLGGVATLAMAAATPCGALSERARVELGGVRLEASSEADRVVFCVSAAPGVNISAMYGLNFDADDKRPWGEALPKTISNDDWEFELPVRVEIETRPFSGARQVKLRVGACSDHCEIETLTLSVPPAGEGNLADSGCAR